MKAWLAAVLSVALATAAVTFTVIRLALLPSGPPPARATLAPKVASYVGVFEDGAPPSYKPVAVFAKAVGKTPNLIGYYSGWAQPFATAFFQRMHGRGVIPYVQIDPTYASVPAIAAGAYDGYLRSYANSVRDFRHAVVIGFGHEMNAPWYSWGYGRVRPSVFIAAWRHIVTLFRNQGAENVTWLWTVNQDRPGTGPVRLWWPGAQYVTWVGIDGYYFKPSDTFESVFGHTISQVRAFTDRPILLSETGVGPAAGQFAKINNLFAGMRQNHTLGLVWFDVAQHNPPLRQDWRIEDSHVAEVAFRLGISALTLEAP
jgi:Glycosyl hydrolase family 26